MKRPARAMSDAERSNAAHTAYQIWKYEALWALQMEREVQVGLCNGLYLLAQQEYVGRLAQRVVQLTFPVQQSA